MKTGMLCSLRRESLKYTRLPGEDGVWRLFVSGSPLGYCIYLHVVPLRYELVESGGNGRCQRSDSMCCGHLGTGRGKHVYFEFGENERFR